VTRPVPPTIPGRPPTVLRLAAPTRLPAGLTESDLEHGYGPRLVPLPAEVPAHPIAEDAGGGAS
jgi:hypothetical protein